MRQSGSIPARRLERSPRHNWAGQRGKARSLGRTCSQDTSVRRLRGSERGQLARQRRDHRVHRPAKHGYSEAWTCQGASRAEGHATRRCSQRLTRQAKRSRAGPKGHRVKRMKIGGAQRTPGRQQRQPEGQSKVQDTTGQGRLGKERSSTQTCSQSQDINVRRLQGSATLATFLHEALVKLHQAMVEVTARGQGERHEAASRPE